MILVITLVTLLVSSTTNGQRIKGGPRIVQDPFGSRISLGKGGGIGRGHHAGGIVQDPFSGAAVVVGSGSPVGGIKSAGLGAGGAQLGISDPFGRGYRTGLSQVPFGLSGSDYYSYPASLLTAPRTLGRKTAFSPNLSGYRPVGFSAGGSQIKTNGFGLRRPNYRSGLSSVPYGLSGSDYYSYPASLLTSPRAFGKSVISPNLSGYSPIGFSAGDSQIQTGAFGLGRPDYRSGLSAVPYGLSGLDYYSYPNSLLTSPRGLGQKSIVSPNLSGLNPIGFSAGDAQIQTSPFGFGRPSYRSGVSAIPYGLMGLDYSSYPTLNQLLAQRRLADNLGLGQTSIVTGASDFPGQSLADPFGSGQTQLSFGDGLGGGITQIQGNLGDPIVQENISGGFGGYSFSPRMSFLSQYPFDAPDVGLLRSVVTSPYGQQQQEVEQILLK